MDNNSFLFRESISYDFYYTSVDYMYSVDISLIKENITSSRFYNIISLKVKNKGYLDIGKMATYPNLILSLELLIKAILN